MTQAYRLQLEDDDDRFIIAGEEWRGYNDVYSEGASFWCNDQIASGIAVICCEQDLLWISQIYPDEEEEETLNTIEEFEEFDREFSSLPRWEATRYAVLEGVTTFDLGSYQISGVALFLYDCRTGQRLHDGAEVERLRRGIEQLMRGERYSFM